MFLCRKSSHIIAFLLCANLVVVSGALDVDRIRRQLEKILHENNLPPRVVKWIAMLHDSIDILRCAPTIKQGNCYKSVPCQIPKLKFDKVIRITLTVCKHPYKIIINFLPLDLPWYAQINFVPLVIDLKDDSRNGIFTVHSDTTIKAHVKHTHFHTGKARFLIDSSMRYDCTKPTGAGNWQTRAQLNMKAPHGQYNKVFYHMHVRIELKRKHVHWGKFDYKCVKCQDLVNKGGVFGYSGPTSCVSETRKYIDYEDKVIDWYKHHCARGIFAGPYCRKRCIKEKKIPRSRCEQVFH